MNGEPRPRHIIRKTFVSIVLLIVVSPASAGQFPEQTMELHMGPDAENRLVVGASTFGASLVTLDASKLRLFARPFETSRARGRVLTLDVRIGAPVLGPSHGFSVTHPLPYVVEQFSMPVTLAKAPRPPGIYDVWPMAVDGFARAEGGAEIPLHADGGFSAAHPEQFS